MTETATTNVGGPNGTGLFARLWNAVRSFLAIKVRMGWFLAAAVIVAVMIAAIAEGVKEVDRNQRAADAREAAQIAYAAQLRTYDLEVRERADCLAGVDRADANRGQHEALVKAWETFRGVLLAAIESEQAEAIIDDAVNGVVADLRAGPLLSSKPRVVEDCPPEPVQPVPPPELIGAP